MSYPVPAFDEAQKMLRDFLFQQGHSRDLLWIFREDVVELWPRVYIRVPVQNDLDYIKSLYDEGVERGLGISLSVYCFLNERACCYILLPEDEEDASYCMLSGLKLSIPDPDRRTIVSVTSGLFWTLLKCCGWLRQRFRPFPNWAADIPGRSDFRKASGA